MDPQSSAANPAAPFVLVNTEAVPGYRVVSVLGLVQGNTVRAKHLGRDIAAGLKNVVGGELKGYTELLVESRSQATQRMVEQARSLGGNGVINVRFSTSAVTGGAAELYVYGTAVVVEPAVSEAAPSMPQSAPSEVRE
jgi:uncharacterized protein YbjQ (UPF0145 family)